MKLLCINNNSDPKEKTETTFSISRLACNQHFGGIGKISNIKLVNPPTTQNTFVHVFWTKPLLNVNKNRWNISSQYELMLPLCALSLACLKSFNQKVILITDKKGKELLQHLNYDEIITILDDYNIQNEFWAAGKIAALQHIPSDAILIDTDLFLYDGSLIDKLYFYDVACSHLENTNAYKNLLELGTTFLPWLDFQKTSISSNTGIIKCNNEKLKKLFIAKYYESIDIINNTPNLMNEIEIAGGKTYCPDLLIEQFNFYNLCNPQPILETSTNLQSINGISHPLAFEKYLHMPLVIETLQTQFPNYYDLVINKWDELHFKLNIV